MTARRSFPAPLKRPVTASLSPRTGDTPWSQVTARRPWLTWAAIAAVTATWACPPRVRVTAPTRAHGPRTRTNRNSSWVLAAAWFLTDTHARNWGSNHSRAGVLAGLNWTVSFLTPAQTHGLKRSTAPPPYLTPPGRAPRLQRTRRPACSTLASCAPMTGPSLLAVPVVRLTGPWRVTSPRAAAPDFLNATHRTCPMSATALPCHGAFPKPSLCCGTALMLHNWALRFPQYVRARAPWWQTTPGGNQHPASFQPARHATSVTTFLHAAATWVLTLLWRVTLSTDVCPDTLRVPPTGPTPALATCNPAVRRMVSVGWLTAPGRAHPGVPATACAQAYRGWGNACRGPLNVREGCIAPRRAPRTGGASACRSSARGPVSRCSHAVASVPPTALHRCRVRTQDAGDGWTQQRPGHIHTRQQAREGVQTHPAPAVCRPSNGEVCEMVKGQVGVNPTPGATRLALKPPRWPPVATRHGRTPGLPAMTHCCAWHRGPPVRP